MRGYVKLRLLCLTGALLVVSSLDCLGQSQPTYSFRFNNTNAIEALKSIDKETDLSIFFREEWLDSLTFTGNYENLKLEDLIDTLLSPIGINHIILNNSIILTGDISIVSSLTFDTLSSIPQTKYLFEREYIGDRQETIPIGNRSLMKVGGTAQIVGYVKNISTGEAVQGALVFEEGSDSHATTDAQGFYSLRLSTGDHTLLIQYTGMKVKRQNIILFSNGTLNVDLEEEPRLLEEVIISSDRNANVSSTRMGAITLNMESLKNVPKVLGENDIIQAALTLPGVQQVGEGSAGINVRGGKTDQNLILLNNATIYNPFHFFGFFSSFNADITGSSELVKSGIPASYGGRLSSLLNMKMKVANKEKFSAKLGLSPVTTKASFEIPLIKEKTSLMVGARTTYSDWIIKQVPNETLKRSRPSFSDFAANLHHSYGKGNSISISGYHSEDKYKLSTDSTNHYTNQNASIEWFHLLHEK
ncbi:MAG: carboxypeptidase-like regulatory domain-containing protein, partial [Cyclobacteriaceae bacterium]|nr:carboxypeptidase-like regulatory domain-containing protein [Cyclobacteriaceae bacterium]